MLCEECHKEPATVHFTKIVNGNKSEVYLCSRCAERRGETQLAMEPSFAFHNILAGLFEPESAIMHGRNIRSSARCSNCGSSLSDFRRRGELGCSQCYVEFERELEPLVKRIHRSVEHHGKAPRRAADSAQTRRKEIQRLKGELEQAVAEEQYEKAAALRDKIRALEGGA